MPDPSQGPWIAFAVLCEKHIEDKLGRLTLINIVDQVNYTPQGQDDPAQPLAVPIKLVAAIGFKGGVLRGANDVKLQIIKPSGERGPNLTVSVLVQGEERSTNIVTDLNLVLNEEGVVLDRGFRSRAIHDTDTTEACNPTGGIWTFELDE